VLPEETAAVSSSVRQVSVVIPTHNRQRLLAMTLRSVLWQRGVDLEAIVVDDGSTDDTADVVRSVADSRVRLLSHGSPRGVSSARNRGIEDARGEWIAFLDDDDLWAPDKLATQVRAATETRATWVYAGAVKIDGSQRIIGGTPPPAPDVLIARLPRWNLVPGGCSGVIVARTALSLSGVFDPRLVNLADWDLWIRLGRTGPPARAGAPLVAYRLHGEQASLDDQLILREAELVEAKHRISLDWGALHHYLAHKCLLSGRRRDALKHFLRAAARGEARPAAVAVWSLLRARLPRRLRSSYRPPDPHGRWRDQASSWLAELGETPAAVAMERPNRSMRTGSNTSQDR
jgi:glycosyltransferase involved in cell wall biosynthesis